jgi:hypothetical protein
VAYQTYIGQTTILGVPTVGTVEGLGIIEPIGFAVQDRFLLAEQFDVRGDIVRVTPYRQEYNAVVTFYPMGIIQMTDFPQPCALVLIQPIPDIPCPNVFLGYWRYVGGDINATSQGLLVMRMNLRKWNPKYTTPGQYAPVPA